MSDPEATAALLAQLKAGRDTGCLTIESVSGVVCRVYLLFGNTFHAEGPTAEGEPALADALSWPDVTLSFDGKARLPIKQTITDTSAVTAQPDATGGVKRLSGDRRLSLISYASVLGGCMVVVVPLALIGIGILLRSDRALSDAFLGAAAIALASLFALWLIAYFGFRFVFFRDAVRLEGEPELTEIPRVVDAPAGVIDGQPELVVKMPARCTLGKIGKCRVEFYAEGLQVWRGPHHPEPRWQFAYGDLVEAESVDLISSGRYGDVHQYFVRLIATRPPIAFLFGSHWFRNLDARLLVNKLREHKVSTFAESFDS